MFMRFLLFLDTGMRWWRSGATHRWCRIRWQRSGPVWLRLWSRRIFRVYSSVSTSSSPLYKPASFQQYRKRKSAAKSLPKSISTAASPIPTTAVLPPPTASSSTGPKSNGCCRWHVHHQFLVVRRCGF